MKSLISALITKIKKRADYNITDPDLDDLVLDGINDSSKVIKQLLIDNSLIHEVSDSKTFKTIAEQEYRDITKAVIIGNVASFTAVAGDKIIVTIDGTAYTTAALTGAVLVATVVTAINLATAAVGNVAEEDANGFLQINSLTTGVSSAVTIADSAGTGAARLFTVAAERTQSAITDLDDIIKISDRENDTPYDILPYSRFKEIYTNPTADYSSTPLHVSRFDSKIFFGATPSASFLVYLDYIISVTDLASTDSSPFDEKYDPLLISMGKEELLEFLDPSNTGAITVARTRTARLKQELIIGASKNIGMVQQSASRHETPDINPRVPSS